MTITYDFDDPSYFDIDDMRGELDRVYDLCHGCRLCWDLCPSFGTLFRLIDEKTDGVDPRLEPADQDRVVDECYQCKLCYVKCPYIPPHEWQLDFPRLMLRALAARSGGKALTAGHKILGETVATGRAATLTAGLANASMKPGSVARRTMEKAFGISADRLLPTYAKEKFSTWWKRGGRDEPVRPFRAAGAGAKEPTRPSFLDPSPEEIAAQPATPVDSETAVAKPSFLEPGAEELDAASGVQTTPVEPSAREHDVAEEVAPTRSVTIFPTCMLEYQDPAPAKATVRVLRHNGCDVDCARADRCCGMPSLDAGDIKGFLAKARRNVEELLPAARAGRLIVVAQPTCNYVLRKEYPEYLKTPEAREVADAIVDPAEYLFQLRRTEGIAEDFESGLGKVGYHIACHLKAQQQGYKGRDLLQLAPDTTVRVVESCSGIDGTWGYRADNVEMAKAIIAPTAEKLRDVDADLLVGDCLLSDVALEEEGLERPLHPMQALAKAYGLEWR